MAGAFGEVRNSRLSRSSMKFLPLRFQEIIVAAALLFGARASLAQTPDDLRLQELFVARLPLAQQRGELQVGTMAHPHRAQGRTVTDVPFGAEIGITNSLQLELEVSGMRYAGAWSAPGEGALGVLYARRGVLRRLDLAASLEASAERGELSTPRWSSLAIVGWRPVDGVQLVANAPLAPMACEDDEHAPGDAPEPRCAISGILSRGRMHFSLEIPLRAVAGLRTLAVVPGITMSIAGFQLGAAALSPLTAAAGYSGARFQIIRDF